MRPPFSASLAITAKEQALRDSQEYYGPMIDDDVYAQEPAWWERIARRDSLPEGVNYRDEGCEYAPACLECPFASCRYDVHEPGEMPLVKNLHRFAIFMQLREQGMSVDQASRQAGISRRTGFRYLAQMRGEPS